MKIYHDAFDAALDAATPSLCDSLGVENGDAAKAYWQTRDGALVRSALMRFSAHVLITEAERTT